jgi:hypothetical protein
MMLKAMMSRRASLVVRRLGPKARDLMMDSMASRIFTKPTNAMEYLAWTSMTEKDRNTRQNIMSSIWIAIKREADSGKKASMNLICPSTTAGGAASETQQDGKESRE